MLTAMAPLLAGCNEPIAATAAANPTEPEVGTFTVRSQARAVVRELPGRIAPTRVSEVRAQVSGIVVERLFQQGSEVKAGDPLYRIDPKPFQVELQASEAALAKATAALDLAAQHARRIATLTSQRAAPEVENEKAIAAHRQAEAEVGSRKAEVARAKLNLDYATVRAPISGAVGAALVSEGALVIQNDNTSLATIQQLDPIYADFTQSVSDMHKLRRAFDSGDLERIAPDAAKARLVLDDDARDLRTNFRNPGGRDPAGQFTNDGAGLRPCGEGAHFRLSRICRGGSGCRFVAASQQRRHRGQHQKDAYRLRS